MSIELRMEPAIVPMSWRQFCKKSPAYSIALDGYLNEGPKLDPKPFRLPRNDKRRYSIPNNFFAFSDVISPISSALTL